jgi:hypothetical protein
MCVVAVFIYIRNILHTGSLFSWIRVHTGREIILFGTENFSYWLEQMQERRAHFQTQELEYLFFFPELNIRLYVKN